MKKTIFPLVLLVSFAFFRTLTLSAQSESDFYVPPVRHKVVKNLVKDYGVDNDFDTDDSPKLQKAINQLSNKGGGQLIIPAGNYAFFNIAIKSNVHLSISPNAVIQAAIPTNVKKRKKNGQIFLFGNMPTRVKNVSISTSEPGKSFTINLENPHNPNIVVFSIKNVENFYFDGISVKDSQTKFSTFTLNGFYNESDGIYYYANNGVIKNCEVHNADYGYGLVQAQAAKNVLFENIAGQGGITLRLETGAKLVNDLQQGGVYNIVGRNISSTDGNCAVMLSPHAMTNGLVTIDGVTANNSGFAVRIGRGFVAKKYDPTLNLKPGTFDPNSSIKNVKATFGKMAQVKPKHFRYIPKELQTDERTDKTPITNVNCNPRATAPKEAVFSVSVAAIGYFSGTDVVCTMNNGKKPKKRGGGFKIKIDESTVEAVGFEYQRPIIDMTDDVLAECTYVK